MKAAARATSSAKRQVIQVGKSRVRPSLSFKSRKIPTIDIVLLMLSAPVMFAGAMYGPVYLDWMITYGTSPAASIASFWTLAAPALLISVGIPFFQRVEDELGLVRMLGLGCAFLFLSGSVAILSNTVWTLLLARAIVGIAAAALIVSTTSLFARRHTGAQRKTWLARQAAVMSFSAIVGAMVVGLLAKNGWRATFLLQLVGLPAYALAMWLAARESTLWRPRYFVEREVLALGGPPLVVLPLTTPPAPPASEALPRRWKLFAFGVTAGVGMMHYFALVQLVSTVIATEFQLSSLQLGMTLSSLLLSAGVSVWQSPRIPRILGYPRSVALAFTICALGFVAIAHVDRWSLLVAGLLFIGFGFGALRPTLSWWLNRITVEHQRARSLSFVTAANYVGISFSPLFVLFVQDWRRLQHVSAFWMLVIAATYLGLSFRKAWSETEPPSEA